MKVIKGKIHPFKNTIYHVIPYVCILLFDIISIFSCMYNFITFMSWNLKMFSYVYYIHFIGELLLHSVWILHMYSIIY